MRFEKLFKIPYFDDKFYKKFQNFIQYGRSQSDLWIPGPRPPGYFLFDNGLCDHLGIKSHSTLLLPQSQLIILDRNQKKYDNYYQLKERYFNDLLFKTSSDPFPIKKHKKFIQNRVACVDIRTLLKHPNVNRFKIVTKNFDKIYNFSEGVKKSVNGIAQGLESNVKFYLDKNPHDALILSMLNQYTITGNVRYIYVAMLKIQKRYLKQISEKI